MSTAVDGPSPKAPLTFSPPKAPPEDWQLHGEVNEQHWKDIWTMLIVIRVVNAVTLGTFFQPDEFFQALEPAWALAFGSRSGAWLTWEWTHQLRSSIYPAILAIPFVLVSGLSSIIGFPPTLRVQLLLLVPRLLPALSAASMDYYTWRLAERVYGKGSRESGAVLGMTVTSPWQWFFSTRTFSNNIEASLTIFALALWPWDWMRTISTTKMRAGEGENLKFCFLAIGVACILRPTNAIIWGILSIFTLPYLNGSEISSIIGNALVLGVATLGISTISDRVYYGNWQSSIINFVRYNVNEGLADFYGLNRPDYYFTEALPQLLTTALPFVLYGVVQACLYRAPVKNGDSKGADALQYPAAPVLRSLAALALGVPVAFSFIGHKEIRFIYPVLPVLLVLGARPVLSFFGSLPYPTTRWRRLVLGALLSINMCIAIYVTHIHGRGVLDVMSYLRQEFEGHNHKLVFGTMNSTDRVNPMSVSFLMPCHSTPWRSQLVWEEIDAWALTCEPPVGLHGEARTNYADEADAFYTSPEAWLEKELQPLPLAIAEGSTPAASSKREWPEYVVFFGQLEETMKGVLRGSRYEECWRGFNTRWHYDWRRAGDIVVYCEDRGTKEKIVVKQENMNPFMQLV